MSSQGYARLRELEPLPAPAPAVVPSAEQAASLARRRWPGWGLRRMLALADLVAVALALELAVHVLGSGRGAAGLLGLAVAPLWIPLAKVYGLYDRDDKRVSHSTLDDMPHVFHAAVMATLGMWLFYKAAAPESKLILSECLAFFGCTFAGVLVARAVVRGVVSRVALPERVLIIGDEEMSRLLIRKIRSHSEYGLAPIGYVAVSPDDPHPDLHAEPGGDGSLVAQVERACFEQRAERVLVVAPAVGHEELAEMVRRMRALKIRVSVVPDFVDVLGPSVEIDDIEGITVLGINPPALSRSSRMLKRAMDIAIAVPVLVLLAPLLGAIALAIRLTSPGPALYSQLRVGRNGSMFRLYKFRTMVQDADQQRERLAAVSSHPAWLLLDHDPRITKVGGVLRRTSLDELPQLYNVLKGDMSLVGPRPMIQADHESISGWGLRRLDLTPGMTGLWQVLGRTSIPFEEMVKLDYLYTTNWSLWNDVRLLIRTLPAVLRQRGAN